MRGILSICVVVLCSVSYAQVELKRIGYLDKKLNESSGIVYENSNSLWTINDGGNSATLYNIDSTGKIIREIDIPDSKNRDWESITLGNNGYLYIGDFGNNNNSREDLVIYRIKFYEILGNDKLDVDKIEFSYDDQDDFPPKDSEMKFDCEAMVAMNDSIFLITKNRSKPYDGKVHIYGLRGDKGKHKARKLSTYDTHSKSMYYSWITDACFYNNDLLLLSHNRFYRIKNFKLDPYNTPKLIEYKLNHFSQKEAICAGGNGELYVTDEKVGPFDAKLYRIKLTFEE